MSYVKTQWVNGDTITADKLNHIEAGIEANEAENSLVKSQIDHIVDIDYSKNLFDPDTMTAGKYLNAETGALSDNSSRGVSDFMKVTPGKYLTFSILNIVTNTRDAASLPSICYYDAGKTAISGGGTWKYYLIVPSNAVYARVCFPVDYPGVYLQVELTADGTITSYEAYHAPIYSIDSHISIPISQITGLEDALDDFSDVGDDVATLKDQMDDIATTQEYIDPVYVVYTTPYTSGYVTPDGTVNSSSNFWYTDKIPVKPGYILTGTTTDHTNAVNFRFVCAYHDNTPIPEKGNSDDLATYTVPDGVNYVVVSQRNVSAGKVRSVEVTGFESKSATNIKQNPMGYMRDSGSMSDGDELHVLENNVKNNVCVAFSGNVTSFDKLLIGQRRNGSWLSCYVEIDDTNITVHTDQGDAEIPHGLTIGDDIQVLIQTENDVSTSLIRICSDGNVYDDTTPHRWLCDVGYVAAVSDGSTLTDCALSWTSRNINAPIWIFGDSYVSLYDVRWVYYLLQDGFDKAVMINGYAGEQSAAAMTALRNLLTVRKPQYIFWILGMNNADSSTAVNTSWKENYDLLINLCKKWNITPVLGTIPSIPGATNEYKNAIIRASGYRYVDFAKAVDPSGTGNWISGTLSADEVHPTAKGAKVLYMRALSDFPELTSHF